MLKVERATSYQWEERSVILSYRFANNSQWPKPTVDYWHLADIADTFPCWTENQAGTLEGNQNARANSADFRIGIRSTRFF